MSPILESIGSVKGFGWGAFAETSAFNSIASTLGGNSSIIFDSIPQTYKHLQLRMTLGVNASSGQSDAAWVGWAMHKCSKAMLAKAREPMAWASMLKVLRVRWAMWALRERCRRRLRLCRRPAVAPWRP